MENALLYSLHLILGLEQWTLYKDKAPKGGKGTHPGTKSDRRKQTATGGRETQPRWRGRQTTEPTGYIRCTLGIIIQAGEGSRPARPNLAPARSRQPNQTHLPNTTPHTHPTLHLILLFSFHPNFLFQSSVSISHNFWLFFSKNVFMNMIHGLNENNRLIQFVMLVRIIFQKIKKS